jgi:predicted membrane chloride channel (bestrophin family)
MFAVLPLCVVNCLLLALVGYVRSHYHFEFSPNGHGLLTLLVSFLVISKVNLAFDRYKAVRMYTGQGAIVLRELIQMVIAISNRTTTTGSSYDGYTNNNHAGSLHAGDRERELRHWRLECVAKVTEILDASVCVLQNRSVAKHFAFNKDLDTTIPIRKQRDFGSSDSTVDGEWSVSDPLTLIQSLRLHLYCTPGLGLELLERVHLVNKLQEYTSCYTHMLNLASTPLPFPLVQMGRAFLLIWTFSMPLVLLDGPFSSMWAAQAFLFFLTYGFIGLELVCIKLSDPFGNGRDDVQIWGIREAAIVGIENDLKEMATIQVTISERRLRFSQQKKNTTTMTNDDAIYQNHSNDYCPGTTTANIYHAMGGGDLHL